MKNVYAASWFLLTLAFIATPLTGSFNAISLVVLSFSALALVYALAIWSVFINTGSTEPNSLRKI